MSKYPTYKQIVNALAIEDVTIYYLKEQGTTLLPNDRVKITGLDTAEESLTFYLVKV